MLFIIELVMFFGGLYALFTAKLPRVISGKKYRVEGSAARLIGMIILLPLPAALVVGFMIGLLVGEDGQLFAAGFEILAIIVAAIVGGVMVRRMGERVA